VVHWGAIREVGAATNCDRFFREVGGQRIYMAVMLLQTNGCLYAAWSAMEAILGQPPAKGKGVRRRRLQLRPSHSAGPGAVPGIRSRLEAANRRGND
jgi:hypothetical protein